MSGSLDAPNSKTINRMRIIKTAGLRNPMEFLQITRIVSGFSLYLRCRYRGYLASVDVFSCAELLFSARALPGSAVGSFSIRGVYGMGLEYLHQAGKQQTPILLLPGRQPLPHLRPHRLGLMLA